jgi:hypothetical protein
MSRSRAADPTPNNIAALRRAIETEGIRLLLTRPARLRVLLVRMHASISLHGVSHGIGLLLGEFDLSYACLVLLMAREGEWHG